MGATTLGTAAWRLLGDVEARSGARGAIDRSLNAAKTNLSFWNESSGLDLNDFCIAATNFSKATRDVSVSCTGYSDISKVDAATAAGTPPDLVQSWDWPELPTLFSEGAIVPLNSYMKKDNFDTSLVLPGALPAGQYINGEYFALPFMAFSETDFFWNKKLFQKKGLDPNSPPTTLEELKTIGEKFDVYKNGKLVRVGFNPVYTIPPEAWCFAFGGSFYDDAKKEITPLNPGVVKGLEWLQSYADKYGGAELTRLSTGYGETQSAENPFLSGQVAMTGFWDALVAYRDRYAPSVDMGFSGFPYPVTMPDQAGWGELSFDMCFIPKGASNVDLAWKLLEFIETDVPTNITVAKLLANTPQNVKAINSSRNDATAMLKDVQKYVASPKQKSFPPPIPVATQYATAWTEQTELMFAGKVSIEKGLDRILNEIQPQLEKALKASS